MITNLSGSPHALGSAQILTSRHGAGLRATSAPAANVSDGPAAKIASGSGWYHDEAIQAEQRRNS